MHSRLELWILCVVASSAALHCTIDDLPTPPDKGEGGKVSGSGGTGKITTSGGAAGAHAGTHSAGGNAGRAGAEGGNLGHGGGEGGGTVDAGQTGMGGGSPSGEGGRAAAAGSANKGGAGGKSATGGRANQGGVAGIAGDGGTAGAAGEGGSAGTAGAGGDAGAGGGDNGSCCAGNDANHACCSDTCIDLRTDSDNCGRCGHSCLGGACEAGSCQPIVLADNQKNPGDLVIAGANLWWTNRGDKGTGDGGALMRKPQGSTELGGVQSGLEQKGAFGITARWVSLYWSAATAGGSIQRINLGGGMPSNLGAAANSPPLVATDDALFYLDCPVKDGVCAGVRRMGLDGSSNVSVASGAAQGWPAANSTHLYWATATTLYRLPLADDTSTVIATNQFNINGIDADESSVFWTVLQNGGAIMKADLDGRNAAPIAFGAGAPNSVTVDGDTVYWAENGVFGGAPTVVAMVPRAGGSPKILYSASRDDVGSCGRPITDEKAIYWLVTGYDIDKPGRIMKLAKP